MACKKIIKKIKTLKASYLRFLKNYLKKKNTLKASYLRFLL